MVEVVEKKEVKNKKPKVMIGLPTKGEMKTKTVNSLIQLFIHSINSNVDCTISYAEGTLVSAVRSKIVINFLESDYDYLLFIDSDMTFEKDFLIKLLEMNKDIACGVAKVRSNTNFNVYHYVEEKEKYAPVSQINKNEVIEIDATGCSCVLIKRKVLEDVVGKKKKLINKFKSLKADGVFEKLMFDNYSKDDAAFTAIGEKSEDILFFETAKACGYKIYCDLGLRCGHVVDQELT